jgi:hypothetical protein
MNEENVQVYLVLVLSFGTPTRTVFAGGCYLYSHLEPPSTLKKQCNGYEPGGTLTVFAGGEPLPVI